MIYQKQFFKETTLTAIAIFIVVLAILVFTQGINLLGQAADGRVAIEAVLALAGFWTLGMTPLLLVLTAYISILTVLTRYWRDSEMAIWLASGLSLQQWLKPVMLFALPLATLVAIMQLAVLPWAELRSREYAEILKQKQNLSLVEAGRFQALGKKKGRVYFVEQFDSDKGEMQHLFIREHDEKTGRENLVFAEKGTFEERQQKRTLILHNGYRYNGVAGQGDFERTHFEKLELIISTVPKILNPIEHRRTIPTSQLFHSDQSKHQAELMWRLSLPITVLLLSILAIPISYVNTRSGRSYHVLLAVGFFLFYQNGLTLFKNAVSSGKIGFWVGFLPMHIIILCCALLLLRMRAMPAQPFWKGVGQALKGKS